MRVPCSFFLFLSLSFSFFVCLSPELTRHTHRTHGTATNIMSRQAVRHYSLFRQQVSHNSRFHIPKSCQLRVYIPKPSCQFTHVANHEGSSSGCAASRLFSTTAQNVPAGCAAKFLYRYSEQRPPVRLMWHRMSLPGPALCDMFP